MEESRSTTDRERSSRAVLKKPSKLESEFDLYWGLFGTKDLPEHEFQFLVKRRFRFDRAWPGKKLAVELEGGTWMKKARHTTGRGYESDCEKYNLAQLNGWRVLRYTSTMLRKNPLAVVQQVTSALIGPPF